MAQCRPIAVIKGAGDLATGVAYRLFKCGLDVIMTEISRPLAVRRKVAFSEAVYDGEATVEGVKACLAGTVDQVFKLLEDRSIPVLVDPEAAIIKMICPDVVVDARMAKRNLGTAKDEAPLVIGLGPGFTAGVDVHAVVETCRGHSLGRVIYSGSAIPDTGRPGNVGGYTVERLLRAPAEGIIRTVKSIGDIVEKGETVAFVNDAPVVAAIPGVLRGLIRDGIEVKKGMKIGDIDPRKDSKCDAISDKALAIGGGVLEAVFGYFCADGKKWRLQCRQQGK
ncbi:hypothetical protein PTH_1534 [Pelotomaculum thermopropionicum SI]|uniref:Xanthine and CO dehydrogenases maturation factor n=1 Tax=Pelotomaculum thermopropionicum (strain DSM 13744 / JCM 10971 / SI) TaxID=370438 RepID=A5D218_PELTS|nr:hypothetical protein PTH_1534 [Pelotomaculum thermopropionicum SI]